MLLRAGCCAHIKTPDGLSAADIAKQMGHVGTSLVFSQDLVRQEQAARPPVETAEQLRARIKAQYCRSTEGSAAHRRAQMMPPPRPLPSVCTEEADCTDASNSKAARTPCPLLSTGPVSSELPLASLTAVTGASITTATQAARRGWLPVTVGPTVVNGPTVVKPAAARARNDLAVRSEREARGGDNARKHPTDVPADGGGGLSRSGDASSDISMPKHLPPQRPQPLADEGHDSALLLPAACPPKKNEKQKSCTLQSSAALAISASDAKPKKEHSKEKEKLITNEDAKRQKENGRGNEHARFPERAAADIVAPAESVPFFLTEM